MGMALKTKVIQKKCKEPKALQRKLYERIIFCFSFLGMRQIDRYMPDATTMKKEFNGIPYEILPIVYIKCSRNNTIINAFNEKVRFFIM